jgi:hypothetical protein
MYWAELTLFVYGPPQIGTCHGLADNFFTLGSEQREKWDRQLAGMQKLFWLQANIRVICVPGRETIVIPLVFIKAMDWRCDYLQ